MNTGVVNVPAGRASIWTPGEVDQAVTEIRPTSGWAALKLGELWRYRELIYFLTWRDIKVRYKQTALGALWAIVQPVLTMLLFTLVFGRLAHLPSGGVPYPLLTLTALLPWTYFAYVSQESSTSILKNATMVSKVYFPRLALPFSTVLAGLVDFAIASGVLACMLVVYGVIPDFRIILLPFYLLLVIVTAMTVGIWLSALSAKYKDVKYIIPFLIQSLLFVSPVAYSAGLITGRLASIYALNPMAGVIEGFRWTILGTGVGPSASLIPSTIVTLLALLGGLLYFRRVEQTFADLV